MELEQLPVFLPRSSQFVVSCDLGQSMDPTAVAVLEKKIGVLDFRPKLDRNCNIAGPPQKPDERIEVRHLERLPLGMTYPNIVAHVGSLLARAPLCGGEGQTPAELVIDETGVGRPVGDLFVESGMKSTVRVTITGGNEVTSQGGNRWHVSKTVLVSRLDALLHTGKLKFAAELAESEAMKNELKDFRYGKSINGNQEPGVEFRCVFGRALLHCICPLLAKADMGECTAHVRFRG
jgi:hypothetical protein